MKLNIGSGRTRYEGFLNCDYDVNCDVDYLFDAGTQVWPFEDSSVEEIRLYHVLEHIGDGYFHFLKEMYRVCKHAAIIDIKVPHHRHDNFHHDPTHKRPITLHGLHLFDKQDNYVNATSASKLGIYYDVDFKVIGYHATIDDRFAHLKNESDAVVEYFAYTHCNVYNECTITLEVQKPAPIVYDILRLFFTHLKRKPSPQDIEHYSSYTAEDIEQALISSAEYALVNQTP